MSDAIQRRRGSTSEHATFTGLPGEITVDTTKKTVVVHDGLTAGGVPLAKEAHNHDGVHARLDGSVFTGNVTLFKTNPELLMNKGAGAQSNLIVGQAGGYTRWSVELGDTGTESGANAGSDLTINAYADGGGWLASVLKITRAAAVVSGTAIATAAQFMANVAGKILTIDRVWAAAVPVNLGTPSGNVTLDFAAFINGFMNPSGNFVLFAANNRKAGQSGQIRIFNPSGRTLGVNTAIFITPNGAGIALGANRNILSYYVDDELLVHLFLAGKGMS